MKIVALQQFLKQLAPFVDAAQGSKTVVAEIGRIAELLEPFKESSVSDFGDFLRRADESVRTGVWPAPGKGATAARKPRASAQPKITVAEAAQKFLSLKERATDATLTNQIIDAEIDSFEPLKVDQLKEVAAQVGKTIPSKLRGKKPILDEFKRVIKELKESHTFNQYRPAEQSSTADAANR